MKEIYDRSARDRKFMIGDRVWVCMPKTKKGLSRKLMHHWHGPYRIVEKCSPVHYKLRTCDNRLVSVTVHANRIFTFRHSRQRQLIPVLLFQMKNYLPIAFSDYHPIKHIRNSQLESAASDTPDSPDTLHNIEQILKHRTRKGKKQILVKCEGYGPEHNSGVDEHQLTMTN